MYVSKIWSPNLSKSTSYGQIQYDHWLRHLQDFGILFKTLYLVKRCQKNVRTMAEFQVERSACMEGSEVEICNHQRPTSASLLTCDHACMVDANSHLRVVIHASSWEKFSCPTQKAKKIKKETGWRRFRLQNAKGTIPVDQQWSWHIMTKTPSRPVGLKLATVTSFRFSNWKVVRHLIR